jgi:ABC-type phosphate transport system substrate-binding protein
MKTLRAALLVAILAATGTQASDSFQIVVNNANPVRSVSKEQLAGFFLKKTVKWADGTRVSPVDQEESAPVRAAFTKTALGRTVAAVASYWQQQIFSGRDIPPPIKASDAAVIDFVKANPGGIGYVSGGATVNDAKVVTVEP